MRNFMSAIGLYDRCDGPQPETRGIFGTGPWHPRAINHVRGARALTITQDIVSLSRRFDVAIWAITENAMCQLDDVLFRAQTDCARLSAYVDDIARVSEYDLHRARFAAILDLSIRLGGIHVPAV